MAQTANRKTSRREALFSATAGLAAPMYIPRSVLGGNGRPGANDRVGVATIGIGFRATLLMDQLPKDMEMS